MSGSTIPFSGGSTFPAPVSLLGFGADPTGGADSTPAFVNALAYCLTNLASLYVPSGRYIVTPPALNVLAMPNKFRLFGDGPASIIQGSHAVFGNALRNSAGYATSTPNTTPAAQTDGDIQVDNLYFDMTQNVGSFDGSALSFYLARRIRVSNVTVVGSAAITLSNQSSGFQFQGCDDFSVTECTFYNCVNCVDCWKGSTNGRISSNYMLCPPNPNSLGNYGAIQINGVGSPRSPVNLSQDIEASTDHVIADNKIYIQGGGTTAIFLDPLGPGSLVDQITVVGNEITALTPLLTGGINYGCIMRGSNGKSTIANNTFNNMNLAPVFFDKGGYGPVISGVSNGIQTFNGFSNVTVTTTNGTNTLAIPSNYNSSTSPNPVYLQLNAVGGGPTTAVGGLTFNGTYLILSVPDATHVIIQAPAAAGANATGGGNLAMFLDMGTPANCVMTGNKFLNTNSFSRQAALTNALTTTTGGTASTVTITDAGHQIASGTGATSLISVNITSSSGGNVSVGGLTLNGNYLVNGYISSTQYTISVAPQAASSATTGGGNIIVSYGGQVMDVKGSGHVITGNKVSGGNFGCCLYLDYNDPNIAAPVPATVVGNGFEDGLLGYVPNGGNVVNNRVTYPSYEQGANQVLDSHGQAGTIGYFEFHGPVRFDQYGLFGNTTAGSQPPLLVNNNINYQFPFPQPGQAWTGNFQAGSLAADWWNTNVFATTSFSLHQQAQTAAVTISIANPAVVTLTAHGFVANQPIQFTTTGALPSPIATGVSYFVSATGLTANTFQFSATSGGASVSTVGGTQSGTQTIYYEARCMDWTPTLGIFPQSMAVFGALGPQITAGGGVPSATLPKGTLYLRTGGGVGTTLYVSQGGGTWNAVAGV